MKKLLTLFSVCLFAVASLQAQNVDKVINTYLEKIGGVEAWSKVESTRTSGSSTTPRGVFPITILAMRPNKQMIEVNVQGMKLIPQAYDGKNMWMHIPFGGGEPEKMPAEAAEAMGENKFENAFINYEKKGSKVSLLGEKDINGSATYEVQLITDEGDVQVYYFNKETSLPVLLTVPSPGDENQLLEIYFSDYKEVEGLLIPFSMEQKMDDQIISQLMTDKVEINPADVSAETFAFPVAEEKPKKEKVKKKKKGK